MVPPVVGVLGVWLRGLRRRPAAGLRRLLGRLGRRVLEAAGRRALGQAHVEVGRAGRAAVGEHAGGGGPLRPQAVGAAEVEDGPVAQRRRQAARARRRRG